MRRARYVELCFLYLGALSFVYFALAVQARKAVLVSQGFAVLAMLLVISTRTGDTPGNAPRLFGVDSLLLAATAVLLVSTSIIVYALRMEDRTLS